MSKIHVYLFDISPPCQAVVMTAKALNLELEFTHINPYEGRNQELLKLNPLHTVPTLIDENKTIVWDSHAILIYLASKYDKNLSLYPDDLETRAHIHQLLHFDSGTLFPRMRFAVDTVFHHGMEKIPEDRIQNIYKAYDQFEATIGHFGKKYLTGDSVTLADISCFSSIIALHTLFPVSEEKYPKMMKWTEMMKKENFYYEVKEEEADPATKIFFSKIQKLKESRE